MSDERQQQGGPSSPRAGKHEACDWLRLNQHVTNGTHSTRIVSVSIADVELTADMWMWLCRVIPSLHALEFLDLSNTGMNDERCRMLLGHSDADFSPGAPQRLINCDVHLRSLDFSRNCLTHRSAKDIGALILSNSNTIKFVNLNGNRLGNHGVQIVAAFVSRAHDNAASRHHHHRKSPLQCDINGLQAIDLSMNCMTLRGIVDAMVGASKCASLQNIVLDADGAGIHRDEWRSPSSVTQSTTADARSTASVHTQRLPRQALHQLACPCALRSVAISSCDLGFDNGLELLRVMLFACPLITNISLSACSLNDSLFVAFLELRSALVHLHTLDLQNNRITDCGAEGIVEVLRRSGVCPSLKSLNLQGNLLTVSGCILLLEQLLLDRRPAYAPPLRTPLSLESMDISQNNVTEDDCGEINTLLMAEMPSTCTVIFAPAGSLSRQRFEYHPLAPPPHAASADDEDQMQGAAADDDEDCRQIHPLSRTHEAASISHECSPIERPKREAPSVVVGASDLTTTTTTTMVIDTPREQLIRLFEEFDPDRLDSVDELLASYEGREQGLLSALHRTYQRVGRLGRSPPPTAKTTTAKSSPPSSAKKKRKEDDALSNLMGQEGIVRQIIGTQERRERTGLGGEARSSAMAAGRVAKERTQDEAINKSRELEKQRKAKEEADRKAKEEADRKAKEEADRKAKEEADRKAKEEADRKAKEDADRKAKEEADRKAKEEADRKAQEDADRKAKEEADSTAKEEAARAAKEERERQLQEESDRKAQEEADRKAKEEVDRKAKEEEARAACTVQESIERQQFLSEEIRERAAAHASERVAHHHQLTSPQREGEPAATKSAAHDEAAAHHRRTRRHRPFFHVWAHPAGHPLCHVVHLADKEKLRLALQADIDRILHPEEDASSDVLTAGQLRTTVDVDEWTAGSLMRIRTRTSEHSEELRTRLQSTKSEDWVELTKLKESDSGDALYTTIMEHLKAQSDDGAAASLAQIDHLVHEHHGHEEKLLSIFGVASLQSAKETTTKRQGAATATHQSVTLAQQRRGGDEGTGVEEIVKEEDDAAGSKSSSSPLSESPHHRAAKRAEDQRRAYQQSKRRASAEITSEHTSPLAETPPGITLAADNDEWALPTLTTDELRPASALSRRLLLVIKSPTATNETSAVIDGGSAMMTSIVPKLTVKAAQQKTRTSDAPPKLRSVSNQLLDASPPTDEAGWRSKSPQHDSIDALITDADLAPFQDVMAQRKMATGGTIAAMSDSQLAASVTRRSATQRAPPEVHVAGPPRNTSDRLIELQRIANRAMDVGAIDLPEEERKKIRICQGKWKDGVPVTISVEWGHFLLVKHKQYFGQKDLMFVHPLIANRGPLFFVNAKNNEIILQFERERHSENAPAAYSASRRGSFIETIVFPIEVASANDAAEAGRILAQCLSLAQASAASRRSRSSQ